MTISGWASGCSCCLQTSWGEEETMLLHHCISNVGVYANTQTGDDECFCGTKVSKMWQTGSFLMCICWRVEGRGGGGVGSVNNEDLQNKCVENEQWQIRMRLLALWQLLIVWCGTKQKQRQTCSWTETDEDGHVTQPKLPPSEENYFRFIFFFKAGCTFSK